MRRADGAAALGPERERRVFVEDYTNQVIALMFMAGALGLPYVPTRTLLGSEYVGERYYPQPCGFLGADKFRLVESRRSTARRRWRCLPSGQM